MSYKLPFNDIAEVVMGQSPTKENINTDSNGFPLLNGPTEFTARCPVPVQFTTAGKKFSEPNDILFCVRGSTGRMNYADQKYAIGRGIAAIRGKGGYPTPYVRAVIEQNLGRLLVSATGSTFPNVGRDLLLNLEVEVSPPEEAKVANGLLVALEDKIEINRQTNQTLEHIAQILFKSWFVDFDPVKAKIAAKTKLPSPPGRGVGGEGNKAQKIPPNLLKNARKLRQSATDAEQLLWRLLRNRQIENTKFRRQHPITNYILDFYAHEYQLAIELDGGQHNEPLKKLYDQQRTQYLHKRGIQLLRFWNNEVLQQTEDVLAVIYQTILKRKDPSPLTPLPEGEGNLNGASTSTNLPPSLLGRGAGGEGDREHPSVTLAAMCAIAAKSPEALAELKQSRPEAYQKLAQTAALFPSAMQESELGEIPEGWTTPLVKGVADIIKGKSYKSSELEASSTALVTLKSFNRGGGYRLDGLKEYTGKYKPEQEVFAGDLIIAYTDVTQAADVIGKPSMVINNSRYQHLVISLDVAAIRPFNDDLKYYLYGMARTKVFQQHTHAHSTGTTVLHLSKNAVPEYKFVLASDDLVRAYNEHTQPIFSKINETIEENNALATLRETLLPKLLSGEILPHPNPLQAGEGADRSPLPVGEDLGEGVGATT